MTHIGITNTCTQRCSRVSRCRLTGRLFRLTIDVRSVTVQSAVLVLTMYDDDDSVFAAMQAGARGYLLKGASKKEMLRAIRDVASGSAIFSPAIARRMMGYFNQIRNQPAAHAFPELTQRERDVLALMAQHHSNQEIAQLLSLSPKTVRNYTSNIFAKLQVADRAEAIIRARDAGLGQ